MGVPIEMYIWRKACHHVGDITNPSSFIGMSQMTIGYWSLFHFVILTDQLRPFIGRRVGLIGGYLWLSRGR